MHYTGGVHGKCSTDDKYRCSAKITPREELYSVYGIGSIKKLKESCNKSWQVKQMFYRMRHGKSIGLGEKDDPQDYSDQHHLHHGWRRNYTCIKSTSFLGSLSLMTSGQTAL